MNEALDKEMSRLVEWLIAVEYKIGETVYLKMDPECLPCQIIGYRLDIQGICYIIRGTENSYYSFELTKDKPIEGIEK